jgi:hypothetical protein
MKKREKNYEFAILWTDKTWDDGHYAKGSTRAKAEKALRAKLEKQGVQNIAQVTVMYEVDHDGCAVV